MADNSTKISQLPIANAAAGTDRLVILRTPNNSPSVRTISLATLQSNLSYANTTSAGVIKVGNNLTVNATGFLNAEAGGNANTGNFAFANNVMSLDINEMLYINNPNNGIQIGGQWLTQMSATSNAQNIWGDGNTESYSWVYQDHNEDFTYGYAEHGAYVQNSASWAQMYLSTNPDSVFWIEAEFPSASPAIHTVLKYSANGILSLPNTVGDIQKDGKSVIGNYPTPEINIVGTALGLPALWRYTATPPVLQYTSNGSFLSLGRGFYWLDQNFDNDNSDFSGITEIHFNNIGGMTDYFQFYKKYEDSLTTIDLGDIAYIGNWFNIGNYSNTLSNVYANNLVEVRNNFEINQMHTDSGSQFVFPALQKVSNLYIDYNYWGLTNTAAPSFPALKTTNSIYIYNNRYISWSDFTDLEYVSWEVQFHNNDNDTSTNYAGPGCPSLVSVPGYLQYYQNDYMTSIPAFSALTTVGNSIDINQNSQLLLYPSFPVLEHVGNITGYNNYNMTGFDGSFFPSLKSCGQVNFDNCSLTQEAVDAILAKLVSLDGTNGTTNFTAAVYVGGGSNAIPSAQGLADIATLQDRGCYVSYNS